MFSMAVPEHFYTTLKFENFSTGSGAGIRVHGLKKNSGGEDECFCLGRVEGPKLHKEMMGVHSSLTPYVHVWVPVCYITLPPPSSSSKERRRILADETRELKGEK